MSEIDYYHTEVKRKNFLSLFLDEYDADKYVAQHLYGAINELAADMDEDEINGVLQTSALNLSTSFTQRARYVEREAEKAKKLTPVETYIALVKGYCILSALFLPRAFQNGGWGASAIFMILSGTFSTLAVVKLVEAGLHTKLYSYSLVTERALGKRGRFVLDVMVALTQYSFAISHITFLVASFKSTFDAWLGANTNPWIYGGVVIAVFTPISWVRDIAKFSFTFLLGNFLIAFSIIFVTVYCLVYMKQEGGVGPDIEFINEASYLSTLGMSVYCYEGIGIVMPVMATCEDPSSFKRVLVMAIVTLTIIYIAFGEIGYLTWGSEMDKPLVTEMLPADNFAVAATKLLYSLNLVCSYPIVINPTNTILESWFCKCFSAQPIKRRFAENYSRLIVVVTAVFAAVVLADKIDKFLGLVGALLCAPLALLMPALIHLILLAKSKRDKIEDVLLIVLALCVFCFSTIQTIQSW